MTRPRRLKRKIELSDEEENTFINNSDYDDNASEAVEQNGPEASEIEDVSHSGLSQSETADQEEIEQANGASNGEVASHNVQDVADGENPKSAAETNENSEYEGSPDLTNTVETANTSEETESKSEKYKTRPQTGSPKTASAAPVVASSQNQENIALISAKKIEPTSSSALPRKCEPRLVIDKLVLTNFKSYAGTQVIGPFNASFSAVVGPNGSGKSNVIDSMLFVFGFRAAKMRQGKLSELIHNSAGGQKLDFCQVDIHFHHVLDDEHNEAKTEVLPDSELVVSRRANKNNSSSYYINGKTSNYTEVTTLLRAKGIDLDHKRFLILQGEVESIAQMKPKAEREGDDGLLEYLEDIIGTSGYKQLIEDGLTKVDELNDVCIEKANRFELVEKDKNQLEDKKNDALKFLEMEKKLIAAQSIQYQISLHEATKSLQENQKLHTELNEEYSQEKAKNAELNDQLKEDTKKQAAINKSITNINNKTKTLNEEVRKINKAKVSMEERIKNLTNRLKKATKTNEQAVHAVAMAQAKLDSQNEANKQYKVELEELARSLEEEKAKLNEIRKKMTSKTSGYTQKIEELQTKLQPWTDKVKEKESAIQLIDSTIDMLESQRNVIEQKLETAKQRLIDIKVEGKAKEAEYQESHTKLTHITEQIALGEEQCSNERKQLHHRKNELANMRQRTQDAMSTHSHNQNKNRVLASLSRLAKSGRIGGFHGRLGDLGVIDDDYDIAVSTACSALDSMVVDTVETAQNCIQYLRKNNLGYANFICLDKLRKFDMAPIRTPGNPTTVKRLFDLITPKDPKFLPAFYSKLFNTLVASNLQEARQVAYGPKRFRVVTLDGKLVDTSGTMSGGGNHFSRGGMILSSAKIEDQMDMSDEDVDQMKKDLQAMEAKFDISKSELEDKEQKLRNLREMKPEIEFSISKLKLEIDSLTSEKKETTQLCKKLLQELEEDSKSEDIEQQIEQKRSEKEKFTEEKEALKSEMRGMESQIKELEEKILEAGGVELGVQNAKVDSINQKIEIINQKTSNERMAVRKLENEIKRNKKMADESSEEIEKARSELQNVESQDSNHQEQLDELNKKINEQESLKDSEEEKLETVTAELEEKKQTINKFKSYEIELENKLEKINSLIKKYSHRIQADQESLDALIVRDTSEYISWMPTEEQAKYNGNEIERLAEDELQNTDIEQVNEEIAELEKYMSNVHVDIEVLKEYGSKITEFTSRKQELTTSISERDQIKEHCEELKRKRLDEFMEGFNTISLSLKEMYQMITMGGNAELELVDSLDPFSEGILFSVMPPKKSWRNISNLSGGEKTLSSLALVFALHKYKPTPLYVMDEIDAALDFRNVSIVANYIKERTKNGQFIVISLRNNMFELAKQLVGIYKVNNMTKSISIQNREFF